MLSSILLAATSLAGLVSASSGEFSHRRHHHSIRGASKDECCIPPTQWEHTWVDCGKQSQNGLVNIGLQACIAADVEAILEVLGVSNAVPKKQWESIWAKCGKQEQSGLINLGVQLCVQTEVEAIIAVLEHSKDISLPKHKCTPPKTSSKPKTSSHPKTTTPCKTTSTHPKTTGHPKTSSKPKTSGHPHTTTSSTPCKPTGKPPKGCSEKQWEKIWADCGKQKQEGLINISIAACVAAEVEALLHVL